MTAEVIEAATCPTWCSGDHDRHPHQADVGGLWVREQRNGGGQIVRDAGGLISIAVIREEGHDDVIRVLRIAATPGSPSDLTSGEARQVAAILLAAADRADGLR